jgi:CBS domain-containing protein
MVRTRLPILLVAEGRHLRGVLTMTDLMRSRGVNVISLLDGIEEQQTVEDLAAFRPEIDRILISLVTGGARAAQVTGIITEFNDRLTRRVVEIRQKSIGAAPAAFAWLGLGSEGRKEQTLTTDQDNAIVIEDKAVEDREASDYFARLADEVVAALAVCGFKLCDGGIMANQPRWAGGLTGWLNRVQSWADEPTPERTRDAMTFLDFRGVYGDRELVRRLREGTNEIVRANRRLLTPMAEDTLSKAPPLGLFKRFLVEKSGPHKGVLNIKTQGALVLIDCIRLLAVNEGLFETNTLERLNGLVQKQVFTPTEAETLTEAYDTLMGLRLLNHVQSIKENKPLTSRINPDLLPAWRRQRLKDAFTAAEDLQKKVKNVFWWVK